MRLINMLFVLAMPFVATMLAAQPVEYEKIFAALKAPDEVLVAEFSNAGPNSIFSVEIKSPRSLQQIKHTINSAVGLRLVSAQFTPPQSYKLILTNGETDEPPLDKLESVLAVAWNNKPDHTPIYHLTAKNISVTTFPDGTADLEKNLQLAEASGMVFSGSQPAADGSSAIFSLDFNPSIKAPVRNTQEEDQLSEEFSKICTVIDATTGKQLREYRLEAEFAQIPRLLELPGRFNHSLKFFSINSLDRRQARIEMKVSDQKPAMGKKLELIRTLITQNTIQWASDGYKTVGPVMTGFETDFGGKIILTGISPKSGLIFSQFFSMVERTGGLKNPFFSRGTYQDTPDGRVMNFRVDCDW